MSNKNIVELTDKQCIAIFEFCTKADKVTPTEDGEDFVILSPDECNEQEKIKKNKLLLVK